MAHDYSYADNKPEVKIKEKPGPRPSTLSFIRQFARTSVCIHGTTLGTLFLN